MPDPAPRPLFEILDDTATSRGDLVLRRRSVLSMGGALVHEVILNGEFLMSSMVHDSERALATIGLEALVNAREPNADGFRVLVGGLGLGYTADAVLAEGRVAQLIVAEVVEAVVRWHREGLLPLGTTLTDDDRCELRTSDFFEWMAAPPEVDTAAAPFDAILVDIDHSPRALLQGSPAEFYRRDGLARLARHLAPAGVFALWSADPIDDAFMTELEATFVTVVAREVEFENPLLDRPDTNVIYVAVTASDAPQG